MIHGKSLLLGAMLMISLPGFSQTTDWSLVNGKAIVEKKLMLAGKSQSDIYKEVYRWLIKVYQNPEDILKVQLKDEYLRGLGYHTDCVKFGAQSSADLQYSFVFEIKNEEVKFNIFNAFLIYSFEDVGVHPMEDFLLVKNSKKNKDADMVLASLNEFSKSLIESFETSLIEK